MQGGAKGPIPSTTPILSITKTGIEFGRPGIMMNKYVGKDGVEIQKYGVVISRNFEGSAFGKRLNAENLTKLSNVLAQMISNVNIEALRDNTPAVIVINEQGETESLSYLEQIKRSTKSNVISANIGTEEEPKWIYTIQPSITFDTKFAGKLKTQKLTTKKAAPKAPPVVPNATKPGAAATPPSTPSSDKKTNPTNWKKGDEIIITVSGRRVSQYKTNIIDINTDGVSFSIQYKDASGNIQIIDGVDETGVFEEPFDADNGIFRNIELAPSAQPVTPTPATVDLVEENAEQLLDYLIANVSPEAIVGIIEGQIQSIEFGTQSAEELQKAGYEQSSRTFSRTQ